jgi:hypothetical protein
MHNFVPTRTRADYLDHMRRLTTTRRYSYAADAQNEARA